MLDGGGLQCSKNLLFFFFLGGERAEERDETGEKEMNKSYMKYAQSLFSSSLFIHMRFSDPELCTVDGQNIIHTL